MLAYRRTTLGNGFHKKRRAPTLVHDFCQVLGYTASFGSETTYAGCMRIQPPQTCSVLDQGFPKTGGIRYVTNPNSPSTPSTQKQHENFRRPRRTLPTTSTITTATTIVSMIVSIVITATTAAAATHPFATPALADAAAAWHETP